MLIGYKVYFSHFINEIPTWVCKLYQVDIFDSLIWFHHALFKWNIFNNFIYPFYFPIYLWMVCQNIDKSCAPSFKNFFSKVVGKLWIVIRHNPSCQTIIHKDKVHEDYFYMYGNRLQYGSSLLGLDEQLLWAC